MRPWSAHDWILPFIGDYFGLESGYGTILNPTLDWINLRARDQSKTEIFVSERIKWDFFILNTSYLKDKNNLQWKLPLLINKFLGHFLSNVELLTKIWFWYPIIKKLWIKLNESFKRHRLYELLNTFLKQLKKLSTY
jgi:hypothetical protein